MLRRLIQLGCWLPVLWALGGCSQARSDDQATTIVVGADVNHATVHSFARSRGRYPTREELLEIHRVWIDNEILYREGLKLPLDAAEAKNREKVIFKALAAIDAKVRSSSVPDDELRRWFVAHAGQYEQLARFDFEDATPPGPRSQADVSSLVARLDGGAAAESQANARVFKGRPESNLVQSYGLEVATTLARAEPGKWLALHARDGWRAMRLTSFTPARAADFEQQREQARRDWIDATAAPKRDAAVRALWKNYKIELTESLDCLADK